MSLKRTGRLMGTSALMVLMKIRSAMVIPVLLGLLALMVTMEVWILTRIQVCPFFLNFKAAMVPLRTQSTMGTMAP